jgi:hypothetical protein
LTLAGAGPSVSAPERSGTQVMAQFGNLTCTFSHLTFHFHVTDDDGIILLKLLCQ